MGIPSSRLLAIVVVKLIAPIREDTPARWRDKIVRSIADPAWATFPDKGGGGVVSNSSSGSCAVFSLYSSKKYREGGW